MNHQVNHSSLCPSNPELFVKCLTQRLQLTWLRSSCQSSVWAKLSLDQTWSGAKDPRWRKEEGRESWTHQANETFLPTIPVPVLASGQQPSAIYCSFDLTIWSVVERSGFNIKHSLWKYRGVRKGKEGFSPLNQISSSARVVIFLEPWETSS